MSGSRYALVSYVRNPVGEFVEKLRQELHPAMSHMPSHLTIPSAPRAAFQRGGRAGVSGRHTAAYVIPFDVELGDVRHFSYYSHSFHASEARCGSHARAAWDQFEKTLPSKEIWPYIPHLTIVKTELD